MNINDNLAVGIDIGTTTISAAVINLTKKSFVKFYTIANDSSITNENVSFFEQNPEIIVNKAKALIDTITTNYKNIKSIGITGQMHGIVYVNQHGKAVSNFIIWQDKRADLIMHDNITYCDDIHIKTGYKISAGYGFATHYYNCKNSLVHEDAYTFCNITDYLSMSLTGEKLPLIHTSMAASFGLFDMKNLSFDFSAVKLLDLNKISLPNITNKSETYGTYNKIPVSVAIGDNQASFFGSVADFENSILVNIGTGSQVSMVSDEYEFNDDNIEVRPLLNDKYLICGSALCGGAAYALLEKFFRSYNSYVNGIEAAQYDYINKLAYDAYKSGKEPIYVNTAFKGKRNDINAKGEIIGITDKNFTPGQLALGFIYGMCNELYNCFKNIEYSQNIIIASGNAIQKNSLLKEILENVFKAPVKMSQNKEEASIGAALFSALCVNILNDEKEFGKFITYKSEENNYVQG